MGPIFARLWGGTAAFFRWWLGELGALVPAWIWRCFERSAGLMVFDLSGKEIVVRRISGRAHRELARLQPSTEASGETSQMSRLAGRANHRRLDVVLRLPAANALRKTLSLPDAAGENLGEVLSFEMDRQTPFTAQQVYFDFRVRSHDAETQRMEVELVAVPRSEVDAAVRRAEGWGLAPDIVDIAGDTASDAGWMNLLPSPNGKGRGRLPARLAIVFAVIAAILAATAVHLPLERKRLAAEILAADADKARVEAMTATKLREQVSELTKGNEFLTERRRRSTAVVVALEEITRLIPDHTSLQQLRIREGEIRLSGLSSTASSLIAIIEKSAMFDQARFRSPVTQDVRAEAERFTISANIVAGQSK